MRANLLSALVFFVVGVTFARCLSIEKSFSQYRRENHSAKGAFAHSTEIHLRCFSANSFVRLSDGNTKPIGDLQPADRLITVDRSRPMSTEMLFMLDRQSSATALFITFRTESQHTVSLTGFHLIPIVSANREPTYLFANRVRLGDSLFVLIDGEIKQSRVVNITIQQHVGYFAPLTSQGTLFVNDVLASCFAHVHNHQLAQIAMFPVRLYVNSIRLLHYFGRFDSPHLEGRHWIVDLAIEWVRWFQPTRLIS